MAYADQNPEAFGSRIRGVALIATTANVQANWLERAVGQDRAVVGTTGTLPG